MTDSVIAETFQEGTAALAAARNAVAGGNLEAATSILASALEVETNAAYYVHLRLNLAAALCQSAQGASDDATANSYLDRAIALLGKSLPRETRDTRIWALAKANLAVALLSRATRSGRRDDVMLAHLSLDSAEAVFAAEADAATLNWVRTIRTHLVALHDRRGQPL